MAFYIEITAPTFALNGSILHKLAAVGLVIGVFAASVLWWETIVKPYAVASGEIKLL